MQDITKAVNLLNSGELVAFPTETVYGLGADAAQPQAVEKIFAAKNRPADHPVIIHIYSEDQLKEWVESIPAYFTVFAKHFWPGPLTLIFKAKSSVPKNITGGQNTIGIRMPSHPIARELLKQFGKAIAAPSANRFGRISPTKASHVQEELGDQLKLIIDGGDCPLGIESTIIDITQQNPVVLRPGPLDLETLQQLTKINQLKFADKIEENAPRVSGSLLSHYAPLTPMEIVNEGIDFAKLENTAAVMSFQPKPKNFESTWVTMPNHPIFYAQILYSTLRELDKQLFSKIYVEMPEDTFQWIAVRDRLTRAAVK
jgi:L-threonylcarbamoyladenylate synthase